MNVEIAVKYLANQQLDSGQFIGYSAQTGSKATKKQPNTFFTSLILGCLREVPGAELIRKKAAAWLLTQRSDHWTWNYWQKGHSISWQHSYPDDLDDTSCALSAIYMYDPELINGKTLACLAQNLISVEVKPGGPYNTWLNKTGSKFDIDPAVNANIGYLLSLQQVTLQPLNKYFDDLIDNCDFKSDYYIGYAPTIYFMARWYKGPRLRALSAYAQQLLESAMRANNSLELALLLSAACNLNLDKNILRRARNKLIKLRQNDHWQAHPLYKDPEINGIDNLAGSETLTTAFALEALAISQQLDITHQSNKRTTLNYAQNIGQRLPYSQLSDPFVAYTKKLLSNDNDGQIGSMATTTAQACGLSLRSDSLSRLDFAGLCGWTAYTIYDHIMDNRLETELLGVANYAQRQALEHFRLAISDSTFNALVQHTLNIVDNANSWEINHARAVVRNGAITIKNLPEYHDYHQLANKSLAHCLASQAGFLIAGNELRSPEQAALRRFFVQYLIARQLNDDAHDWEQDFINGHLSPVVCELLHSYGLQTKYKISSTLIKLRELFWKEELDKFASLIQDHLDLASEALASCKFTDASRFQSWLNKLQAAAQMALAERNKAIDFMEAFK